LVYFLLTSIYGLSLYPTMGDNKKFYMSGIQEYIDETQDDTDLYFKYGVYLASTGAKFDIS